MKKTPVAKVSITKFLNKIEKFKSDLEISEAMIDAQTKTISEKNQLIAQLQEQLTFAVKNDRESNDILGKLRLQNLDLENKNSSLRKKEEIAQEMSQDFSNFVNKCFSIIRDLNSHGVPVFDQNTGQNIKVKEDDLKFIGRVTGQLEASAQNALDCHSVTLQKMCYAGERPSSRLGNLQANAMTKRPVIHAGLLNF